MNTLSTINNPLEAHPWKAGADGRRRRTRTVRTRGRGGGGGKRLPQPPQGGRSVFGDLQVMYTA